MPRIRLVLASIASLGLLPACADDPPAQDDTGSAGTTEGSSSSSTTEAPTTGTSTGDEEPALEYARGIRLTRVTANQGVQVEIVRDGVEIPAEDYAARLITGRKTVMRADWLLHADFTPRELIGRLTLWTPEGETRVDEFKTMVTGPSNDGDLYTTFSWELPASFVRPGLQYRIEALEPDAMLATGEVSEPPPVLPLPGRGTLAVQDTKMEIKVAVVPLRHVFDGMTCEPEIGDADLDSLRRWLEQHNPVERAVLTLHAPLEYTASIGTAQEGFVPILNALSELRAEDMPPENLYYYALIESCDGYPPGLLGQAFGIPEAPTKGNAFQRLATGRYLGSGSEAGDTFVHEVGHSQGRRHVRCTGGEAGTDPNYPHSNGRIGNWGYGIHDTQMRSPTGYRDYMSYCLHSWVSDYGWEQTYGTIAELSSWDAGAAAPAEEPRPIAVATLMPNGRTHVYTTVGTVPAGGRGRDVYVEYDLGGEVVREPASLQAIPDSDSVSVVAALPAAAAEMTKLTIGTGKKTRVAVAADRVVRLHSRAK